MSESGYVSLYTDGSSIPNSGNSGIGFVIYSKGIMILEVYKNVGHGTSNEAEYKAIIQGLKFA